MSEENQKPTVSRDVHVTIDGECCAAKVIAVNADGTIDLAVFGRKPTDPVVVRFRNIPETGAAFDHPDQHYEQAPMPFGLVVPREPTLKECPGIRWHWPERNA
jgi:hypothetical protein